MTPHSPDPPEPGRFGAGHEIEPSADAVLDQLRRLDAAWQFDLTPAAAEIDAVARAVDGLRGAIERAAEVSEPADEEDLDELLRARAQLSEAMVLAERFLRLLATGGPEHPTA